MAVSACLISKAALVTNVADVALAITAVRVLAISRAAFRYLERYVTHRATFRILSDLRVWFFAAIEPLAPARLEDRRSGDLLTRIVADIDTLEDLYVRVARAAARRRARDARSRRSCWACSIPCSALRWCVPGAHRASCCRSSRGDRRAGRREASSPPARELDALLVDQVQGIADLVALDRAAATGRASSRSGRELDRAGERLALVRGLDLGRWPARLAGLAGVTVLAIAIRLVTAGRLDGVYLALLPLAAIASFEADPAADASRRSSHDANEAAARRCSSSSTRRRRWPIRRRVRRPALPQRHRPASRSAASLPLRAGRAPRPRRPGPRPSRPAAVWPSSVRVAPASPPS